LEEQRQTYLAVGPECEQKYQNPRTGQYKYWQLQQVTSGRPQDETTCKGPTEIHQIINEQVKAEFHAMYLHHESGLLFFFDYEVINEHRKMARDCQRDQHDGEQAEDRANDNLSRGYRVHVGVAGH
jgi:hypothetical protein